MSPTPPPSYPADAACATSEHPPGTWDERIDGETPQQRQARYDLAFSVCNTCPVTAQCYERRTEGGGIRDSVILPDRAPDYIGADYVGLDPWRIVGHGTQGGYRVHLRLGQDACDYCNAGNTSQEGKKWAKRKARHAA
jgi:hypothetical protein